MTKKIAIIGGGFSGTLTAIHLISKAQTPFELFIFAPKEHFSQGVAYFPYSKIQLLNVIAAKMSAFPDKPNHFLDWLMQQNEYANMERDLIANAFLPRYVYGKYLAELWKNTLDNNQNSPCKISLIFKNIKNLSLNGEGVRLDWDENNFDIFDFCVLATGNHLPRNPSIENQNFYQSKRYFQNPWAKDSVAPIDSNLPILILGNGLTMVDTVLGLLEEKITNPVISISPNGFNILPHRHNGLKYTKFVEDLREDMDFREVANLLLSHIRSVRKLGISAEPVIDSVRPHTQKLWQKMSDEDKKTFMARFRHLWGVARHRIPLHIHDKIQQLRMDGKMFIHSGKILSMTEENGNVLVKYFDKKLKTTHEIKVARVVNCTGPETDFSNLSNHFLKTCLDDGIIVQDALKLGMEANPQTYQVKNSKGEYQNNLRTLGGNMKGVLWESTGVNELRVQAEQLADLLLNEINNNC